MCGKNVFPLDNSYLKIFENRFFLSMPKAYLLFSSEQSSRTGIPILILIRNTHITYYIHKHRL